MREAQGCEVSCQEAPTRDIVAVVEFLRDAYETQRKGLERWEGFYFATDEEICHHTARVKQFETPGMRI
jgi:hypothetical protein